MATNAPITFTFAGLPGGTDYCFTGYNRFALDIASNMSGFVPGAYSFFNYGNTPPTVDDRDKPWFNTNDGQWYFYDSGEWIRPHPVPASSSSRILWVGAEADLWSYDGGDGTDPGASAPTANTGAMWEIDEDFTGRYLAIVGAMPGGSSTTVVVGTNGGADQVTIAEANIAPHRHGAGGTGKIIAVDAGGNERAAGMQHADTGGNVTELSANWTALAGGTSGAATPINVVPPFRGIYLAKRTARVNYVA